jgi:hypothetical protein
MHEKAVSDEKLPKSPKIIICIIGPQVRNGKRTAILAIQYDKMKKDAEKKNTKVYVVYRPNTGQQVCVKKMEVGFLIFK